MPCYIQDCTKITASGYVGSDVEDCLAGLLRECDYDLEMAQNGIVMLDEIDKNASAEAAASIVRDVSDTCVQQSLLKIVEGDKVGVLPAGGRKHPEQPLIYIDTSRKRRIVITAKYVQERLGNRVYLKKSRLTDMKEMNLKQLSSVVRRRVRSMLNTTYKQGRTVSLDDCIKASRNDLREMLVVMNGSSRSRISGREFDRWIESAERDIRECAEACYMSTLANIKSKEVARAGASAIVETILKEKGISRYYLERQVHGLKVLATLPNRRCFRFRIRYSRLQEDLSHVAEGIDTALHLISLFDKSTSII